MENSPGIASGSMFEPYTVMHVQTISAKRGVFFEQA
jgi:hypothetical protein